MGLPGSISYSLKYAFDKIPERCDRLLVVSVSGMPRDSFLTAPKNEENADVRPPETRTLSDPPLHFVVFIKDNTDAILAKEAYLGYSITFAGASLPLTIFGIQECGRYSKCHNCAQQNGNCFFHGIASAS